MIGRASTWLLRALLRLLPRGFRERHGEELVAIHRERMRGRSGTARLAFALREAVGMLLLATRLRLGMERDTGTVEGTMAGATERIRQDVGFALRALRRNRGYAAAAVAVLALGIGANTAVFSAANAYFFRPLPFADAERLVTIYETNPEFGWTDETGISAAPANVLDWREQVAAFDDVATYSDFQDQLTWVEDGEPVLLDYVNVSGNFFDVLGVPAAVGRGFVEEETWSGRSDVVVLSHGTWTTVFGADRAVIGRTLDFGGTSVRVVGVMPEDFAFPGGEVDLWTPWGWDPAAREAVWFRRAHFVRPVARLAPGVSLEEADAQLQVVVSRLQRDYPETNEVMGAGMEPLRAFLIRGVRTPLVTLVASAALLLLLACVNVANLTLVRGGTRRREVALRLALGAGRRRVASLMATESAVLAAAGGATGLGLGWLAVRSMESLTPLGIQGATDVAIDHRVALATLVATAACAVLFGLAPAWRAAGGDVREDLEEGGRGGYAGSGARATRVLIGAEVALALLIAAGAGLMARTAWELRQVDPGFRTSGVLAFQVTAPDSRYQARDDVLAFHDRFLEALEGRPGIERAGMVGQLPLSGPGWSSQFQAESWPPDRVGFEILHRRADRGYFEALGIPLVRGRLFGARDGADAPPVVVVNETFVREYFPAEDPIGRRIAYDRAADSTSIWREIVGVVGDQSQVSPGVPVRAEVFEHRRQDWARTIWVVVRTRLDPLESVPAVRETLRELDPLVAPAEIRSLHQVWRTSMAREELVLTLLGAFGVMALALAAVGVFGVIAQAARRRTREIGIRMALGAAGQDVVRLVLRQGIAAVVAGLAVGFVACLLAARLLEPLLFGVEATDPATLVTVAAMVLAVAGAACWIPARKATRVDPVRSLRSE